MRSYIAYRQARDTPISDEFGHDSYPLIWTRRFVIREDVVPALALLDAVKQDDVKLLPGHYTFVPEAEMVDIYAVLDIEVTHVGGEVVDGV